MAPLSSLLDSRSSWSRSAPLTIVRNFMQSNGLPPMPGRIER